MASTSAESVVAAELATPLTPPQSPSAGISPPFEEQQQRPKLKGRHRLLAGLQRISSSQSLSRAGSSHGRLYNGNGRGAISCISLASASSLNSPTFGNSLAAELSYTSHTAPTSGASTPGLQVAPLDERARVRYISPTDTKSTATLPAEVRPVGKTPLEAGIVEVDEDYFSLPVAQSAPSKRDFNFWRDLPSEIRMEILAYLGPRELVRCSAVSRAWHGMCFDGQLWSVLDTAQYYTQISADGLVRIINGAGPFVRDLNLRGCNQLRERWHARGLSDACRNLENFSLEGCKIDRTSIHNFLYQNPRLVHINLSTLAGATNSAMKIIAMNCPKLEVLNVSWCNNVDTRGLKRVVEGCPNLRELRAGETRGWDDVEFAQQLFLRNSLECLTLINCDTLTDEALTVLIEGQDTEVDYLTGRAIVPPRKLKVLDLIRCQGISDQSLRKLANNVPDLQGLNLSKCRGLTDSTLTDLFPNTPYLTHLDLEEQEGLTNAVLQGLAAAPCAKRLRHLSISYCENLGDVGMIPVLKACRALECVEMDNTRISDLVLTEAAAMMAERVPRTVIPGTGAVFIPKRGLDLVAYDCQNVTWTGVREILARNGDVRISTHTEELPPLKPRTTASASTTDISASSSTDDLVMASHRPRAPAAPRIHIVRSTSYPTEYINLRCFYTYQPTVVEHTRRIEKGDFLSANRLERKWAEFMMAQEEAAAAGGSRRRRRRVREAQMMHADEEDGPNAPGLGVGGGRRRRARSGGCLMM